MKADCLTKLECSESQRRIILHSVSNPNVDPNATFDDFGLDSGFASEDEEARTFTSFYSSPLGDVFTSFLGI